MRKLSYPKRQTQSFTMKKAIVQLQMTTLSWRDLWATVCLMPTP